MVDILKKFGKDSTLENRKQVTGNQSSTIADRKDPHLIQIPGSFFPHAKWGNTALWFEMTARELTNQSTAGPRGGSIRIGRKGTTFKFLAPSQIVDNQQHTWEEYASIQSRLLQFIMSASTSWDQIKQIVDKGGEKARDLWNQIKSGNIPAANQLSQALVDSVNVNIPKRKIDTPLRYVSSARRTYQLTFMLADSEGGATIQKAVELLQKYAAPTAVSNIDIEFPYVFQIQTVPFGLITVQYAALENVLVTWMEPYIKGKPSRAEVTLGFKDMSPLFRKTIERGGIVNVNFEDYSPEGQEINRLREATRRFQEFQKNYQSSIRQSTQPE